MPSLEKHELRSLIDGVREIEHALGDGKNRTISQGEMINRENLAKSLVASQNIPKGTKIESHHIKVLSPGQGLSAQNYNDLLGKKIKRDIMEEDYFYPSDLNEKFTEPRNYKFSRPWGIPVRYHDFAEYNDKVSPDIFEFHLSYSDLDLDINEYLSGEYTCGFVVHAPELFSQSRLMDLASPDKDYRNFSIQETQRVIEITRNLNKYFPSTNQPKIVANIGGFTMDEVLPVKEVDSYYKRFAESLSLLDSKDVEIIP